jgi:hypothetical protein
VLFQGFDKGSVMNKYWNNLIIGIVVCLFFSCEQYAIFDAISKEVKPKPALIKGTPSKIVEDSSNNLYVANGELWKYESGRWNKIPAPSGVRDVAVGPGGEVFIITVGDSPSLSLLSGGTLDGLVPGTIQGIYGANSILFGAVGKGNSYSVHAYDGTNLVSFAGMSGLLQGAAYSNGYYYLATSAGLYIVNSGLTSASPIGESGNFLGVIAVGSKVVAVTSSTVYEVSGTTPTPRASVDSLTGALAVFGNTLYLGRSRGYRTITDTSLSSWTLNAPTTSNYSSTIAQVNVTSMFALNTGVIFASVRSSNPKRSGLMSLRNDSWNMEE